MRAVLDHLTADDEIGLVSFGQSNRLPTGDRDTEGFVEAPHLQLRAAGLDLTIEAIVPPSAGGLQGAAGTRSIVNVAETLVTNDWVNAELRLVQHEYGDAVASSLRRGHAKVLSNAAAVVSHTNLAGGGSILIDAASGTIVWPGHGRKDGSQVVFTTTGTPPAGLVAGAVHYVRGATDSTFRVSVHPPGYGPAASLAGGTGTHTFHARAYLLVEWGAEFQAATAGVTFSVGTPGIVNHTAHGLTAGSTVSFDVNTPPELSPGVKYWVVAPTANAYSLTATPGGAAIAFTGAGGAATATPDILAHVSGYVHLHDRFNSYDNVHVVTPYQPIEPGDYPAGTPVVPGVPIASDVTSYADLGLVLPFAWNEGIDGFGAVGTATVVGLVVTLQGGTIADKLFAGGFIRVGGAKGKVASNTTTTVTVESWTPGTGPGAGTLPYELHLPHWRNNPHHWTAGEGFLYPSDNMQPGGGPTSLGFTYSRPRGRLTGSYVNRVLASAATSAAINATAVARLQTTGSGQLTISIVSSKVRVQCATPSNDPATQLIQFEHFLRPGYIVGLTGTGQTPSVDSFWRVVALVPSTAAAGSYIDLDVVEGVLGAVPGAVAGVVPAGARVNRMLWQRRHGFGSLLEIAWRMAVAVGRRVVVAHLGINSAGQLFAKENNAFAFQGKLGWWDDDDGLDWTPSNPDGLAARLKRVVEFIAPRAVSASLGTAKRLKVLAIDAWQAETDALTVAGRDLAQRSIPAFVAWLRSLIGAAGLSPYPSGARIPLQWAQITHFPWETAGLGGDTEGKVNAAILRMVAFDGFAAALDVNASPKAPLDPLHFTGVGQARNGRAAAQALLPLIDFAFQFSLGPTAVDVANQALSILGDAPNVTSLEPPNATTQARLCAQFMPEARRVVLQHHPWSFATRRVAAVAVQDAVSTWSHAYAVPADLLNLISVLDPQSPDDVQIRAAKDVDPSRRWPTTTTSQPAGQPFTIETDQEGHRILRTNQEAAVLVYTARNVDFAVWDPMVRQACAYRLAYLLAGATLKGKTGVAVAERFLQQSLALLAHAAAQNAEWQRDVRPETRCPWLP